jgi:hypothetical protein
MDLRKSTRVMQSFSLTFGSESFKTQDATWGTFHPMRAQETLHTHSASNTM